ncbi:uncharacterized protein LOC128729038 [Anopheles nili]|uniref:uncharacterized protein LOC128729038 n=1 Tax=Anopheles nili TaxID=185578 RepID=UPI00237BC502|nr:uncharacterized protein LOC128729038 [Anopheles nili]
MGENPSHRVDECGADDHERPDGDDCIKEDEEAVGWDGAYGFFDSMNLEDCLRFLAITHQLPRSAVNMMLAILRKKLDLDLPKDARTLMKTPSPGNSKIVAIQGGDFWYGGLKSVLTKCVTPVALSKALNPEATHFSLDVSSDGLPLHKAGPTQLWPILVKVVEFPKPPVMTVATFSGPSKPESIEEFLRPLVNELYEIHQGGLVIGDRTLHFKILNFIADSPARALIKEGNFERFPRWSPQVKEVVSKFLVQMQLPSEIHRTLRSVQYVAFWKASEFRTFLHYASVVDLKDCYDAPGYSHFLLYFCGVTILSSSYHQYLWIRAKDFLFRFFKDFGTFYGRTHMTSNVHNLQHVFGEVTMFGPLDDFSAYCFENHLQQIKQWVRSGKKCAEQVAATSNEIATILMAANIIVPNYPCLKRNGIGIHVTADFVLMPNFKDQWFLTKNYDIVKCLETRTSSLFPISVVGIRFLSKAPLFVLSAEDNSFVITSSADIHIYQIRENAPTERVELSCNGILCKLVAVRLPAQPLTLPSTPTLLTTGSCFFFAVLGNLRF